MMDAVEEADEEARATELHPKRTTSFGQRRKRGGGAAVRLKCLHWDSQTARWTDRIVHSCDMMLMIRLWMTP